MTRNQRAFTIIELMITLAVLAVLAAIAAPMFNGLIANSRSNSLTLEMATALNLTRSEALKRGRRVSICSTSNGAACDGAPWPSGWIIFLDNAATDTALPVVGTVIKQWNASPPGAVVNVTRNAAAVGFVRFTGQGLLARPSSNTDVVTVVLYQSGCQGNSARQLEVGIGGRVSQSSIACP